MVKDRTNSSQERPVPLGTLLSSAARRLSTDLDRALRDAGFDDVRSAHAPLFLAIDSGGSTATELAERTHMSKQAMGELVRYLTERGYLTAAPNPADRRARILQLTDRGADVLAVGLELVGTFDAWFAEQVGAKKVADLRRTLQQIIAADWQPPRS